MGKFISSKAAIEFVNPNDGTSIQVPANFIGEVPDWVPHTKMYKLATSGDNPIITSAGEKKPTVSKKDDKSVISKEETDLRKKAEKLKIDGADKLPLQELVTVINNYENPPLAVPSKEETDLRKKAEELKIEGFEKLSIVDLVNKISEIEKVDQKEA